MINQKSNILVITHSMETLELQNLVRRGISGCILQNESEIQISQAVRSVGLGGLWFSKAFLEKLVPNIAEKGLFEVDDTYDLTTREWEVAKLIADGLSNREIALSLKIKERTVEFHVTNILQKLNVNSRVTVAIWISNIIRTYPENRQVKN